MWENLNKYDIILGSQSPRRVELLGGLDITFRQDAMPDLDESYPNQLALEAIPEYLAVQKAGAYSPRMNRNTLLITADTIVLLGDEVLGKPQDLSEAKSMLHKLSGQEHRVITGVCVQTQERCERFSCTTLVRFAHLTTEDIDYYIEHYRPLDKAGAYGIQEWIGYRAIQLIEGSFYNVMGLPVHRLSSILMTF
ncbi:Maf family nucleotide pyrophosphatase [Porphyromonas sp. COT-290 OH860]|uniref:Maf family nucleotide pyrophosphatase n=1 Tax=Porphyromonas sp. COT-290 OH860 TaxID=1515615 RepID=UPI00052B9778|nr:Maf family nucleotide pyrophosphatase [Porphyromonas sp. COT-290 OH860]KGN82288.1 septum formation inhibitor Maf [Porphyromonas sp. COT-290 OH860]